MAKLYVLLVVCQMVTLPFCNGSSEGTMEDVLQQLGGNTDNIANMISNIARNVESLKGLGDLFGQSGNSKANSNNNALDMLSGLGSLLGGKNGQFDPAMLGGILSMVTQQMGQQSGQQRQKRGESDNDINLESLMGLASTFLGGQNQNGGSAIPLIMNAIGSMLSDPEKRAEEHKDHADFLPPFVEKLHLYWDLFINSDLGNTIWEKSGLKKYLKAFTGPDGKVSVELMMKNFENQSFRRHWIKAASKYLTDVIMTVVQPEVYQRYVSSAHYIINSFLDAQGLPKYTHFDANNPEKSITALVNYVLKKYLDMDANVGEYVKSAVAYMKKTMKMAESASKKLASRSDYNAVTDRVTDTLNLEIIEPVMRVYRAYKHSVKAPHCAQHLLCVVNKHPNGKKLAPGLKAGLTKFSSIVASAVLSYQSGKGFWDLYDAMRGDHNCEDVFPADCAAFHEHELKVTTEVYHSEL